MLRWRGLADKSSLEGHQIDQMFFLMVHFDWNMMKPSGCYLQTSDSSTKILPTLDQRWTTKAQSERMITHGRKSLGIHMRTSQSLQDASKKHLGLFHRYWNVLARDVDATFQRRQTFVDVVDLHGALRVKVINTRRNFCRDHHFIMKMEWTLAKDWMDFRDQIQLLYHLVPRRQLLQIKTKKLPDRASKVCVDQWGIKGIVLQVLPVLLQPWDGFRMVPLDLFVDEKIRNNQLELQKGVNEHPAFEVHRGQNRRMTPYDMWRCFFGEGS